MPELIGTWETCPDCLHPGWAHQSQEDAELLVMLRHLARVHSCIGQDCRCQRLSVPGKVAA